MKDNVQILTLQETEELCRLYLDCRLSALEERELRYVLTRTDHDSALIREVGELMGMEELIAEKGERKADLRKRRVLRKRWYFGAAASVALLMGIGIGFFHYADGTDKDSYYIAYANGLRLSGEAAKRQVESDLKAADALLREMEEREAREKQMIENFTYLNLLDQ